MAVVNKALVLLMIIPGSLAASSNAQFLYINEDDFIPTPPNAQGDFSYRFGWSVGIWDQIAIIGARDEDVHGDSSGAAYLYDVSTNTQLFRLIPATGADNDFFGHSVAISSDYAAVGATGYEYDGLTFPGAVFVYDPVTGNELYMLKGSGSNNRELLGDSVAIDGDILLAGASETSTRIGSVYLFDLTTGNEITKINGFDGPGFIELFGAAVAVSGDRFVVGAPGFGDLAQGNAYLYDTATQTLIQELQPNDLGAVDGFGRSVAISDDYVYVGTPEQGGGAVYMFHAADGQLIRKITINDENPGAPDFGTSLSVSGDKLIVGADNARRNGLSGAGAAYVLDANTGQMLYRLYASDPDGGDTYGTSVTNFGDYALVGAPRDDVSVLNSGSAYLFETTYTCPIEFNANGQLDFFDVGAFISLFMVQDPSADLNADGQFNFFDVSIFLQLFENDCY
ncbi:MAG: PQQ-binding-like beta-propeller repeat protein [Phycisphaerales bacterium]|nr:PQQ-binding-like beta-propeller repeat protein [Phycisphaerales bacterium]